MLSTSRERATRSASRTTSRPWHLRKWVLASCESSRRPACLRGPVSQPTVLQASERGERQRGKRTHELQRRVPHLADVPVSPAPDDVDEVAYERALPRVLVPREVRRAVLERARGAGAVPVRGGRPAVVVASRSSAKGSSSSESSSPSCVGVEKGRRQLCTGGEKSEAEHNAPTSDSTSES